MSFSVCKWHFHFLQILNIYCTAFCQWPKSGLFLYWRSLSLTLPNVFFAFYLPFQNKMVMKPRDSTNTLTKMNTNLIFSCKVYFLKCIIKIKHFKYDQRTCTVIYSESKKQVQKLWWIMEMHPRDSYVLCVRSWQCNLSCCSFSGVNQK